MKTNIYRGSIEKKLTKIILIVTSLAFFIAYLIFVSIYLKNEDKRSYELTQTIETVLSQDLAKLVFLNDVSVAADITTKLKSFSMLESAVVYKNDETAIYQYKRDGKNFIPDGKCKNKESQIVGRTLIVSVPIHYSGRVFGCIRMKLEHITFFDIFKKYIVELALFYLFIVSLSFVLAYMYAKKFTNPILKLIRFLEEIELSTSLDKRIKITEDDEFGKLYEETNIMLEGLQKSFKEKEEAREEVEYLRQYDSLTGLPNKELFIQSLQKQIDFLTIKQWHLMFCVDIDKFKIFNDLYGHEVGDIVLQIFASKLKKEFKNATIIAKIGIDEFLICYRNVSDDEDSAIQKAEEILNRLNVITAKLLYVHDKEISISAHVGINIYSKNLTSVNEILKQTDGALQNAKKREKQFSFYSKEAEKKAQESLDIYSDLLVAIQENQFELYYQLQNRDDGSYIGAESLIRWNHPEHGLVSPFKFIPIAENSGLIIAIGTWVLETACKQLSIWQENPKTREWVLAVNVSAKQFAQDDFLMIVKNSIEMYSIHPNRLKIELTESLLADDFEAMVQKMQKLRELGIQISIDDFGTGYSSLQYLKMLPINQIKIDQGFIFEMLENHSDQIIVQSIINLGKAFGFDVIAEGVETEEHFEKLKEFGCHYFQGYLFARPEPIGKIEEVIAQL